MSTRSLTSLRLWVVIFTLGVLFLHPSLSFADTPGATPDCARYAGLTNRIVSCIQDTLHGAASAYFDNFYTMLSRAITALMTLAIAIYGVLAAAGMIEKVGRDTIMLILKIAFIGFFVTHVDTMYDGYLPTGARSGVIPMMDATARAVINFTPSSGEAAEADGTEGKTSFSQIKCLQSMIDAQKDADAGVPGPWIGIDCMIDSVIGIKVPPKTGVPAGSAVKAYNDNLRDADQGMSRGMLYFFFSTMQTSAIGLLFAIVGFIFVYGLIHLIIKALFIYIAGYIGITFLMILAPLFIPLVLFKQTKDYFDKWLKLVINFTLQPIIVLVFISFSISAVDLATYSGTYSVMNMIAGKASRDPGFSLNDYLVSNNVITRKATPVEQIKADDASKPSPAVTVATEAQGWIKKLGRVDCSDPTKCDNSHMLDWWHDSVNWDNLAAARHDPDVTMTDGATTAGQQISREVLSAILFSGIVVFVMNGLLQIVPSIISDLLGDFGQSPNLFAVAGKLPTSGGGLGGIAGSLANSMKNMVSGR